jgi:hypothetical protein
MNFWKLVAAVSLVLTLASACSSPSPVLPDRKTPAVKAEETRVATLLAADRSVLGSPGACKVRLLGQDSGASFVYASCRVPGPDGEGASGPYRVEGTRVTVPADGAGFSESVHTMFPDDLAEYVLKNAGKPVLQP